jgi:hypothetical protein
MDCYVLPNGKTNGELINYDLKKAVDFREKSEPDLFVALDSLLNGVKSKTRSPTTQMVLGRLREGKKTHYYLNALDAYSQQVPEAKIWALVNEVFRKWLKETNGT